MVIFAQAYFQFGFNNIKGAILKLSQLVQEKEIHSVLW